ncbi:peptidase inhibitor family I36 protein [Kibdelosporangium persicum]|uniref:Peptidase inhibitor family I36 n=1 Tax=Kibdelosporangium persicum TaxID=2698649 RepID=A0ABX2FAU1_9PSEU|nr:peptidase inhibitor family I36 protein [Kibdelosporangium persicum]NRN68045.1 Peptidase inhibitor family I36 [Kibdelosporangium persicum]
MVKRSVLRCATAAAAIAGAVTLVAPVVANAQVAREPASCPGGYFCAYDGTNYGGTELLQSNARAGSDHITVASDRVTSAANHTGNYWCAVNASWPADITIWRWAPGTHTRDMGSGSNRTDWFYVRTASQQCD